MNEYAEVLSLLYFKEVGSAYDWGELREVLGYTSVQLDNLIQQLMQNGFIEYKDFEIQLTEKGLLYLVATNQIDYYYRKPEIEQKDSQRQSLDTPYIPKGFDKKYKIKD